MKKVSALTFITLIYLAVFVVFVSPADAKPWQQAIEDVQKNADEMTRRADELGHPVALGTLLNEIDIPQHTCSILGRMLGKADVIRHLEEPYPNYSRDGYEFRLAAQSMENWIRVAQILLIYGQEKRIKVWNIDCAGNLSIPLSERIPESTVRTFYEIDGDVLRIIGDVEAGFHDRIKAILSSNGNIKRVAFGSSGGHVLEAVKTGFLIRSMKLDTELWNNCYSACTIAFLGGVNRHIWSPYPDLGFHQVSVDGRAVPFDDPIYRVLAQYAYELGVEPRVFIGAMLSASPSELKFLTHDELCESGISTFIQRSCLH